MKCTLRQWVEGINWTLSIADLALSKYSVNALCCYLLLSSPSSSSSVIRGLNLRPTDPKCPWRGHCAYGWIRGRQSQDGTSGRALPELWEAGARGSLALTVSPRKAFFSVIRYSPSAVMILMCLTSTLYLGTVRESQMVTDP